jgi:hypothetical protein
MPSSSVAITIVLAAAHVCGTIVVTLRIVFTAHASHQASLHFLGTDGHAALACLIARRVRACPVDSGEEHDCNDKQDIDEFCNDFHSSPL